MNATRVLKNRFQQLLSSHVNSFREAVSTPTGKWKIKGFVDTDKNIYTISLDTKVLSKIMELLIFPKIVEFANNNQLEIIRCAQQNSYPDITFKDRDGNLFAVDIKSSYRKSSTQVNGMTLGAFTGYFRDRTSTKNITFPYDEYVGHFVLGLIYSRSENHIDEHRSFQIEEIEQIDSVAHDIQFFVQEKYKIAIDMPGSGNTKNIGGVINISDLISGNGPFARLGDEVFDDYWVNYLTTDMASARRTKRMYSNLTEYKRLKGIR